MKKGIFLILTLAIPVAIFLFLKIFGSNEFEVPILFESGIPGCVDSQRPHLIPEFEGSNESGQILNSRDLNDFMVFCAFDNEQELNTKKIIELIRIQDAFYEVGSPYFILLAEFSPDQEDALGDLAANSELESNNFSWLWKEADAFQDFLKCGIALKSDNSKKINNLVLVDTEKKIRGIYDAFDLKQTDQLILELKILKQMM